MAYSFGGGGKTTAPADEFLLQSQKLWFPGFELEKSIGTPLEGKIAWNFGGFSTLSYMSRKLKSKLFK